MGVHSNGMGGNGQIDLDGSMLSGGDDQYISPQNQNYSNNPGQQ